MKTEVDYQGNVRAVIDADGATMQTTDYYPYGMPMATSTAPAATPYKFGGKELETRLGLNFHDFEARMLFNDHTLFSRPDPYAGKYPHLTPYLYCAANPLRYIDPTGEDWIFNTMTSEYLWDKDVTSNNNLPENCRYIGQNINSVFSDLGIINGTITQHEPKVGITLSGNTSCGIPTGTSTDINSAIVLKPQIELMKDGSTLKFNGINVFGSISQKSFSANPDLKLEYNGTMTITQNGTAVRVGLNEPNGENINQLNTSIKCASTFIPLSNLIDKAPIQVKIEAGAINSKVTLLPLPFKMDVTIKY